MLLSSAFGFNAFSQLAFAALPAAPAPVPFPTPEARTFNAGTENPFPFNAAMAPTDIVDYAFDWTGDGPLALDEGEVIASSSWSSSGLAVNTPAPYIQQNGTSTTAWLSLGNGAVNESYIVTNQIKTSGGRNMSCSFTMKVNAVNFN